MGREKSSAWQPSWRRRTACPAGVSIALAEERASGGACHSAHLTGKKSQGAERLKPGYTKLLELSGSAGTGVPSASDVLLFAFPTRTISTEELKESAAPATAEAWLEHYMTLTKKVCENAACRVLQGETLANEEKITGILEPHGVDPAWQAAEADGQVCCWLRTRWGLSSSIAWWMLEFWIRISSYQS